ncbi:MAG: cbb3-type cytochrome oxidase assembly protein CcoS [Chitinophagaceae bacterium]
MSVLLILLIISIIIATGFLVAFLWSVNNNQFDDIEMPQHKILFKNNLNNNKI